MNQSTESRNNLQKKTFANYTLFYKNEHEEYLLEVHVGHTKVQNVGAKGNEAIQTSFLTRS